MEDGAGPGARKTFLVEWLGLRLNGGAYRHDDKRYGFVRWEWVNLWREGINAECKGAPTNNDEMVRAALA